MAAATTESGGKVRVVVGVGSCGIAAGAQEVKETFERLIAERLPLVELPELMLEVDPAEPPGGCRGF